MNWWTTVDCGSSRSLNSAPEGQQTSSPGRDNKLHIGCKLSLHNEVRQISAKAGNQLHQNKFIYRGLISNP